MNGAGVLEDSSSLSCPNPLNGGVVNNATWSKESKT